MLKQCWTNIIRLQHRFKTGFNLKTNLYPQSYIHNAYIFCIVYQDKISKDNSTLDIFCLWHREDCPEWEQGHLGEQAHKTFQFDLQMSNDCKDTENVEVQQKLYREYTIGIWVVSLQATLEISSYNIELTSKNQHDGICSMAIDGTKISFLRKSIKKDLKNFSWHARRKHSILSESTVP